MQNLIFLRHKQNRYSLAAVVGAVSTSKFEGKFRITVIRQWSDIDALVKNPQTTHFAFSFMSVRAQEVKNEVAELRSKYPQATFLAGGAHATAVAEETLALGFDHVFAGPGEDTLVSYLESVLARKEIPSIIQGNPYDSTILERYTGVAPAHGLFAPVEISRGCLRHCRFCHVPVVYPKGMMHRSLQSIERICRINVENGRKRTWLITPNAIAWGVTTGKQADAEKIEKLLTTIKESGVENIHFGSFPSEINPEMLNPQTARVMARFCSNRRITIGGQSGSEKVLQQMRRGHTVDDVLNACAIAAKYEFIPHVDILFATPNETFADQKLTCELIDKILTQYEGRVHVHHFMPLPGTPWQYEKPAPVSDFVQHCVGEWVKIGRADGYFHGQHQKYAVSKLTEEAK
jgi:B12-binding domain/radical SAM domain protein